MPEVLEEELKRLAENLRVPVSNVVRAILEDALDAVDTVGQRAEGEILGFVERLAKNRSDLRSRMAGGAARAPVEPADDADPGPPRPDASTAGGDATDDAGVALPCPADPGDALDGVIAFQSVVLAADARCGVCARSLPAGSAAERALFDDLGRRVFVGRPCRLVPGSTEEQ
ncbi:MAG: hypothetical protein ACFCGT_19090 [Sandaracinaceae bacterium]